MSRNEPDRLGIPAMIFPWQCGREKEAGAKGRSQARRLSANQAPGKRAARRRVEWRAPCTGALSPKEARRCPEPAGGRWQSGPTLSSALHPLACFLLTPGTRTGAAQHALAPQQPTPDTAQEYTRRGSRPPRSPLHDCTAVPGSALVPPFPLLNSILLPLGTLGSMLRTLLAGALLLGGALAQTSTNATCASSYDWMSNAEGQSPCLVAADLQGVCNDDKWFIPSLPSGTHYVGPLTPALGTLCICNTVVYNLVSACAACQGGEWVAWADWTANCSVQVMTRGSFPGPVPGGTSVPAWAEVDTSLEGSWNAVEARTVAASGLPDTFPSSTSPGITTSTSFSSSPTTTSPASSSHTNVGAIAGGVVGGVLLLLLLLLALFLLRMRKNRRNAARTAPIPLPTSYSSLSSRGANSSPPTGGERDGSVIVVGPGSGYSGYPSSPGAEKAGFLSTHSAHGHGTGTGNGGTHSPPYSPNSPLSPAFPPSSVNTAASQGTGTGGTFSGSGTNPASSGFVLYDPNDPATWPTNVPVGLPGMPHSPGGTRTQNQRGSTQSGYLSHLSASGSLPSPGGAFPSHYPGYSMGEAQPGPGSGAGAASVAGGASAVLDSDRAYSPVPTPAPTYRSSASPAPGRDGVGDRVLLRGPARVVGKRRGGGQGQGR